jgi:hypothetical protein
LIISEMHGRLKHCLGGPRHPGHGLLPRPLVDIAITYGVTDDFDRAPACTVAVTSNEPAETRGDGSTWLDCDSLRSTPAALPLDRGVRVIKAFLLPGQAAKGKRVA